MKETTPRLAVFLPALYGGGAERTMLNLAQGLAARGHAVDLLLARAEGPYLEQVSRSLRVIELNTSRMRARQTLGSIPGLVHYLRRERPHAMVSAMFANLIAIWGRVLARAPTRLVVVEQNTFSRSAQEYPRWYARTMRRLMRRFYPCATRVVAVSCGVADDLARAIPMERAAIQVIYNPVLTPELRSKASLPARHPWFASHHSPVILAAGRLAPQKDYPTLLQAFAQVRQERSARLLILGEGPDRPVLERMAEGLGLDGDFQLPGFVDNPYPLMAGAAAFALSSRWEGLPTVLIEAMYCGAPVVATDCPSGPREILHDGEYGALVGVGDTAALARALVAALDGHRAPPPAESWLPYDSETVLNQYSDLLMEGACAKRCV